MAGLSQDSGKGGNRMKPTTTESPPVRPIIQAINLSKTFRTLKRKPGFVGAIHNLFSTDYEESKAVDHISFELAPGELVATSGRTARANRRRSRC
jgi:ABC-type glutathione transport system ATPase component